jgi:hypothetical protein
MEGTSMRAAVRTGLVLGAVIGLASCGGGGGGDDSGGGIPHSITLTATPDTPVSLALSWTSPVQGVTGYDLYRDGVAVTSVHLNGTSYRDGGLEPASRHCYVVYAVAWPFGSVAQSDRVCATTSATAGWLIQTVATGANPSLALDAGNQPHVVYRSGGSVLLATRSGGTWYQSTVEANGGADGATGLGVDSHGADQVSYADTASGNLMYASNLVGVWVTEVVDAIGGSVNALGLDGADRAHIAYAGIDNLGSGVVRYASNASGSWQTQWIEGWSDGTLSSASLAVDQGGFVHFAVTGVGAGCVLLYYDNVSGNWRKDVLADDCNHGAALGIDSSGHAHIAYSTSRGLKLANNSYGSWQSDQLDSFYWLGGQLVSLAIDGTDHMHIAYQDESCLKYATNFSGTWERYFIDCKARVGSHPAIAADATGRILIAYNDEAGGTIRLASSR